VLIVWASSSVACAATVAITLTAASRCATALMMSVFNTVVRRMRLTVSRVNASHFHCCTHVQYQQRLAEEDDDVDWQSS
jgi:hypothetical protein